MKCPVCDVALSISSREGIEIDFCPQCRGVWLDRGELDKIIERAAPVGAAGYDEPRRPEPRREERGYEDRDRGRDRDRELRYDDRYDRGYGKKRRRGSFLEDIFDFD